MPTSGIQAFLELLYQAGCRYIFGNPGTTELPLNDALLTDRRLQYILALQEVPVMAIADGYAMASRRVGVVNLHISPGLGHAMGLLYNAWREGTPLLVTAGQQDRRLQFEEPILGSDLARVAEPWTKWSAEVRRVQDLPSAVRRALQIATTPPTGPVFLSLPLDVQMEIAELDLSPAAAINPRLHPPAEVTTRGAQVLLSARAPAILAGSRVLEQDAVAELTRVAELLGAPVIAESGTTHGRVPFPCQHPLQADGLPLWSPEVLARLSEYDVLLVVGMDLLRQYVYFDPPCPLPAGIKIVQIDEDPCQLGKNYPLTVAIWGETKAALGDLANELAQRVDPAWRAAATARSSAAAQTQAASREKLLEQAAAESSLRPMTALTLMEALSRVLPPNVAVIEEAVTTTNRVFERLGRLPTCDGYFGHRGWGLGWGLGCAIGVKLAWPDRPVLGLIGDGAAMYGIQGLWTAARYQLPVVFVIPNNRCYQILKVGARGIGLPGAMRGEFHGLDLDGPIIDYVGLARSLGVEGMRITEPAELSAMVDSAWSRTTPLLIEVPIDAAVPTRLNY
ncbi:MAG: thiamine pyrophosphate-binding protein [Pirellulales bacterium]|nr:thiamine pyrophosphate-binding protein [Pirellulales bacterium]